MDFELIFSSDALGDNILPEFGCFIGASDWFAALEQAQLIAASKGVFLCCIKLL